MIIEFEGHFYGDTACVQASGKHGALDHTGWGDFRVGTPQGCVDFGRCNPPWDGIVAGWSGRVHRLKGPGVSWLVEILGSCDAS